MKMNVAKRYLDDGMAVTPRPQLVVRLYARLLNDLDGAIEALDHGRLEASHDALVHAQDIVYELNLALDLDRWAEGRSLRSIYEYVIDQLIEANVTKQADPVRRCVPLITPLLDVWQQALAITQTEQAAATVGPQSIQGVG